MPSGASTMPQIPPALAALFAQRAMGANQAPGAQGETPAITPPAMTPGPAAPMRNVFGMPQGGGMFQSAARPGPAPSDDPAMSGGAGLPSLPDTSGLTAERQKASDIESKIASIHAPVPEDYKPSIWRRLLSVPIATAAGYGNPQAGAAASDSILHGGYRQAQSQYEAQVSPLQKQLEYERGVGVPLAESEARLGQERFTNQLNLTKENREQTAFQNETGDKIFQETGTDGKIKYYQTTKGGEKREVPEPREQAEDRRRREEDANSPAPGARPEPDPADKGQWRIKTKAGNYIPYTPKSIDEGALLGDKRAKGLYDEAHRDHSKENADANGYTPSEQREIAQRTRRFNGQLDVLNKQRAALSVLPDNPATKKMLGNIDKQLDSLNGQVDAIENEVISRRTSKAGQAAGAGFQAPQGAPPAKGVPDGHQLKMNGKVIAVAKGGQWVAPNSGGGQ